MTESQQTMLWLAVHYLLILIIPCWKLKATIPALVNSDKERKIESSKNISYQRENRHFWDGGLMTNTPLTQLVLHHRNYWYQVRGLKDKAPTLGICVVNVHPTRQPEVPTDHDGIVNRNNDITFSDRSQREEEALLLISDYVDLVWDLIKIAKENGIKDDAINKLLNDQTKYHGYSLRPRQYRQIVEGRYDIGEIIRIERKNDEHTISDKTFDFSSGTIAYLLANGYEDTINVIKDWETKKISQ